MLGLYSLEQQLAKDARVQILSDGEFEYGAGMGEYDIPVRQVRITPTTPMDGICGYEEWVRAVLPEPQEEVPTLGLNGRVLGGMRTYREPVRDVETLRSLENGRSFEESYGIGIEALAQKGVAVLQVKVVPRG